MLMTKRMMQRWAHDRAAGFPFASDATRSLRTMDAASSDRFCGVRFVANSSVHLNHRLLHRRRDRDVCLMARWKMEDDVQAIVNELSKSWRKHQSVGSQSMNTNLENQLSLIDVSMLWRRVRILACVRLQDHDAERESVSSTTTQPQPHPQSITHNHNHTQPQPPQPQHTYVHSISIESTSNQMQSTITTTYTSAFSLYLLWLNTSGLMYTGVPMHVIVCVCCGLIVEIPKSAILHVHLLFTNRFCGFKSR